MYIREEITKIKKCPGCPHYEQITSYGKELLKCGNKECPHFKPEGTDTNK